MFRTGGDGDDDDVVADADAKAGDVGGTKSALAVRISSRFSAPVVSASAVPSEVDDG